VAGDQRLPRQLVRLRDDSGALEVAEGVQCLAGDGMGSYSVFNAGVDIFADHAFEVPTTPGVPVTVIDHP